jgi:hypothetical protein
MTTMSHALLVALWALSISPDGQQKTAPHPRPACQTQGKGEITITCTYTATRDSARGGTPGPRVAITRAVISGLDPGDASNLRAELTFTNAGTAPVSEARTVYLAIDDDAGNNYVRRILPSVDFRSLVPGKPVTFSEDLRIAAFPPGHYTITLWIPDPEPSRKFNAEHNFLLSSARVADRETRLNILAEFTVARPRH